MVKERPPPWVVAFAGNMAALARLSVAFVVGVLVWLGVLEGWEPVGLALSLGAAHMLSSMLEAGLIESLEKASSRPARLPARLRVESSSTLILLLPLAGALYLASLASVLTGRGGAIATAAALALMAGARGYASKVALVGLLYGSVRASAIVTPLIAVAGVVAGWSSGPSLLHALATAEAAGLAVLLAALRRVGALDPGLARRPSLSVPGPGEIATVARLSMPASLALLGLSPGVVLVGVLVVEAGSRLAWAFMEETGRLGLASLAAGPVAAGMLGGWHWEVVAVSITAVSCLSERLAGDPLVGVLAV